MDEESISAIIGLAQQAKAQTIEHGGKTYAYMPSIDGAPPTLKELTEVTPAIRGRVLQKVSIASKDSFVAYIDGYSTDGTRIFADINNNRFVAALDYHEDAAVVGACEHTATYTLQESEQWARWSKVSGTLMGQADFVRFLEENAADIVAPSGADLMEICRDFSAARKVDFREAVRLESGARQFEYSEDVRGTTRTGEIEVPSKFTLMIPVFYGEPNQEIHAFLRFRIDGGLSLGIELHRPKFVKMAAFELIGVDIHERTQAPLYYGALGSS